MFIEMEEFTQKFHTLENFFTQTYLFAGFASIKKTRAGHVY